MSKKTFIIGAAALLGFVVVIIIFAIISSKNKSGTTSNKPVALTFWGTFENSQNMAPFIQAYEQAHPNVRITYTEKNVDTYEQDLLNALAAGNGPDIFQIHNDWLPSYQNKLAPAPAKLVPLADYKQTFLDVVNNDFVSNNQVYAIPLSVDTLALYYNKDILAGAGIATPPTTWAELQTDTQKITRKTGAGFFSRSGVAMGTTSNIARSADLVYLDMLQDGVQPYTADHSQSTLSGSIQDANGNTIYPAVNALNFYTSFANPNSDNYTWNQQSNYDIDAFANGQLAFMYGYSYMRSQITAKAPNLNFDVAVVPQPTADNNPVNFANYWGNAVSKQSKNTDWAWDFIRSMATQKSLAAYYKLDNLPSSRRDLISSQESDPVIGVFAYEALSAKDFYKSDADKVDAIINKMVDEVTLSGNTVQQAVNDAAAQINQLSQSQ